MSYKSFVNPNGFKQLEAYGVKFTNLGETFGKLNVGLIIGAIVIIQVLFGFYSVKAVSIPLFLTFRRCSILSTVIVQYFIESKVPSTVLTL